MRLLYLTANLLSSAGSAMALLASTLLSSAAGSDGAMAATYTSLMLALNLLASSLVMPYAPFLCSRFGTRRVTAVAYVLNLGAYAVLCAAIVAGLPGYPILVAVSPLIGAMSGLARATTPPLLLGYLTGEDLASAEAKTNVAGGAGFIVGAAGGAYLIDLTGPLVGFVGNIVLTIPFTLLFAFLAPTIEPQRPTPVERPWRAFVQSLRTNHRLRRASILGLVAAALVGPLGYMIVPVTQDLGLPLAVHAGLILAAIALGAALSPVPVYQLGSRIGPLGSSGVAYAAAGVTLVGVGIVAVLLPESWLLAGVLAIAVVYGALLQAGASLLIDDAAEAADVVEHQQQNLAVFFLVIGLGAPLGTVLWGRTIDQFSASTVLLATGVAMTVFVAIAFVVLTRRGVKTAPAVARHPQHHGDHDESS